VIDKNKKDIKRYYGNKKMILRDNITI